MSCERAARLSLLASLLCAAPACATGNPRERQSAADVTRAEESLRVATNAQKARALALLSVPCVGQDPCDVQRRCRDAYRLHIDAVGLTAAAQRQLADGKPDEAAKLLGSAERKLEQARGPVADCTDRAGALRRRYHW